MTEYFVSEAFLLRARIKKAGYVPARVWKLYKHLRGELHIAPDGSFSRSVCTKIRKEPVERAGKGGARYGYCMECGRPIPRGSVCKMCGYDNYWAIYLGLTKEKKSK